MGNIPIVTVPKTIGEFIFGLVRSKKFAESIVGYKMNVGTKNEMFIPHHLFPEDINMDDAMEVVFYCAIFASTEQEPELQQHVSKIRLSERELSKEISNSEAADPRPRLEEYKQVLNEEYRQVNQLPTLDDILNNGHVIYSDDSSISFNEVFLGVTHHHEDPNRQRLIGFKDDLLKISRCKIESIKRGILRELVETEERINLISREERASIETQQVEQEPDNLPGNLLGNFDTPTYTE